MLVYEGRTVYGGQVSGNAAFCIRERTCFRPASGEARETERYERAKQTAFEQLDKMEVQVKVHAGDEAAAIFFVHKMLLEDFDYVQMILDGIGSGKCAEKAVFEAGKTCAAMFEQMDDVYLKERWADMVDLSARLIACLDDSRYPPSLGDGGEIVIAREFYPSEMAAWQMSGRPRAMISSAGSEHSHASILAREFKVPSVVQVKMPVNELKNRSYSARVDADTGWVWLQEK